ncbi:MAG: hypothetical protein QW692_03810 [Nitrososphaerota archaeon]
MSRQVQRRKVSEDLLLRIRRLLEEIRETKKNLARKYFELGMAVDLAIQETGASYRDIAEELQPGYSYVTLERAHKFFKIIMQEFSGDIDEAVKWLDENNGITVEFICNITRAKEPEPIAEQVTGIGEEAEETGEEEPEIEAEELRPPDWRAFIGRLGKYETAEMMLAYERDAFLIEIRASLLKHRIPRHIIVTLEETIAEAYSRLTMRIIKNLKEIFREG